MKLDRLHPTQFVSIGRSRIGRVACGLTATAILLLSSPVLAAPLAFTVDAGTSRATFTVESTLHDVHGTLYLRDGEIEFDPETGAASGRIVVDATRTETGNAKRDKKMHDKVLESPTYPSFVFEPSRVSGQIPEDGAAEIEVSGSMSIHGERHPMTLDVAVEHHAGRVSATAQLSIPYVEWGLKDPSVFVLRVGKVVEVSLELQGTLESRTPLSEDP